MVTNIFPTDTPSTKGVGSKGQTTSFFESSHVAYHIKADDAGSNMVANIMPTDTPSTQGVWSKGQTISFLKVVMFHIKLKGIEHRAPWKQTCCHYTHQRPLGWGQKAILFFFSKSGHVAYQIKVEEVETYMQGNALNLHTPLTSGVGFKGQILKLCGWKYFFY